MQILGLIGAALILVAYGAMQFKLMRAESFAYNLLNAVGSAILAYIALRPVQAGFLLLEGTWAVISVYALLRTLSCKGAAPSAA